MLIFALIIGVIFFFILVPELFYAIVNAISPVQIYKRRKIRLQQKKEFQELFDELYPEFQEYCNMNREEVWQELHYWHKRYNDRSAIVINDQRKRYSYKGYLRRMSHRRLTRGRLTEKEWVTGFESFLDSLAKDW